MLVRFGRITLGACVALVAVGLMAGCGGNQSAPQNTGTVAPGTPMSAMQNSVPMAKAAPIPKGLNCKGDVVWVNLTKKTYHGPTDPWYGRTKNGQYMCKAAADAAGYHMAGMKHSPKGAMHMMATPAPYAT